MAFTVTAFQGVMMGSVVTLNDFLPAFLAFAVSAIVPLIVMLAADDSRYGIVLANYSFILPGLIIGIAMRVNRSLRQD